MTEGSSPPRRWARIRPERERSYDAGYHGIWFRVVEGHDPDVPDQPGQIWVDLKGTPKRVPEDDFETITRPKPLVLLVDDEASIRRTLAVALANAGHEVIQAPDGETATQLWRDRGPDLIISDIHMPKKSGLLLIQDIRELNPSTRIIAMTDGGPAKNAALLGLAQLLGAVRTIAKPFGPSEMLEMVKEELK